MYRLEQAWTRGTTLVRQLWSDGRGWILVLVASGWILSLGVRQIFPVLFPYLGTAFNVDLATLGLFYTLLWMAYAVGQFPAGAFADRLGEGLALVFSTLLSGVAILLIAISLSVPVLVLGMLSLGLATALYGPTRFTILTDIYSEYDGTAVGITQAAGHVGNATIPVIAGILAGYFAWQAGFLFIVPFFFVVGIALWFIVPKRTATTPTAINEFSWETLQYVLRNVLQPTPVKLTVVLALTMFSFQAVTGFYPTYLAEMKSVTPTTASMMYGLFFVCAVLIQPISGIAGDVLDLRKALIIIVGVQAVSLLLLPFTAGIYQLVGITVALSSFFGTTPILIPSLARALPKDMKGSGVGLARSGYFLVAASGSVVVGSLADRGFFDEAFLLLSIPPLIALVLVYVSFDAEQLAK